MVPASDDDRAHDRPGARSTVTDADRAAFAQLSGDHNPIHTDPVAARRLLGGRMLVHGAHLLLHVVDRLASDGVVTAAPLALDARFLHGVEPGTDLTIDVATADDGRIRATVTADVWRAVDVAITPGDLPPTRRAPAGGPPPRARPDDVALPRLAGRDGTLALTGTATAFAELVPHATAVLGAERALEIASLSRVVGMRAPGLRSMSSRYQIRIAPSAGRAELAYRVTDVDDRMRRATIAVTGPSIEATVDAFAPPGPVDQLAPTGGARPDPDEFRGHRVLVIGGSRGLGAATTALLAAGGADVRFTYRVGGDEAAAVAAATGARAFRYDASDGPDGIRPALVDGWRPDGLCWFASPPYTGGTGRAYSERLRDELLGVQVAAFEQTAEALLATVPAEGPDDRLRTIVWPSTALVDAPAPDTRERVDVALAGEAAVARLADRWPGLDVAAPRLPALLTDQTLSVLPVDYRDTASCLLRALRAHFGA